MVGFLYFYVLIRSSFTPSLRYALTSMLPIARLAKSKYLESSEQIASDKVGSEVVKRVDSEYAVSVFSLMPFDSL